MHTDSPEENGFVNKVVSFLSYISALGLFSLMMLVFVSVFFRYMLNAPLLFAEDVMAILLGVTIFTGVPSVTLNRRHISVDLLSAPFKKRPKLDRIRLIIIDAGVIGMTYFMAYLMYVQATRYYQRDTISNTMEWQLYSSVFVFMALILAGGLLFTRRALRDKGDVKSNGGLDI